MDGEIVYADLDIAPGKRCRKLLSLPQPGTPGCPRWHRTALWAGWTGNLLLGVAVVATGCLFLHQQSEHPGSCQNGSGKVEDGSITLESVRSELRKGLCSSKLQEGEGCKLCPVGWTLYGTKCYWVADRINPWSKGKQDCVNRSAELLMPADQDELSFVKEMVQKPTSYLWIGLSVTSAGTGWTWLNGSRLDNRWFQLSPWDKPGSCGVVREDRISSDSCSSALQWICQKEATQL